MKETKEFEVKKRTIELKPYSQKELAKLYGVCSKTFKKWIKPFEEEIGKQSGRYYTIPQVKIIFQKLSLPSVIEVE